MPFFQEFMISFAFIRKRAKAPAMRTERAMVMMVVTLRNL
jgi:hypothetical protein